MVVARVALVGLVRLVGVVGLVRLVVGLVVVVVVVVVVVTDSLHTDVESDGHTQTCLIKLNSVPFAQGISTATPLAHCRNLVQSQGLINNLP